MFYLFLLFSIMSSIMYKVAPLLREYPVNHSRIMYNIKPVQTLGETMPVDNQQLQGKSFRCHFQLVSFFDKTSFSRDWTSSSQR